jgi:DNA replication protein DnaC
MEVLAKPREEWTEEDRAIYAEFEEEVSRREEAERKLRAEQAAALKAEQERRSREYWASVYSQDKNEQNGTMEWFLGQLNQRNFSPEVVRITNHPEMVPQYLAAAYRSEVERNGGTFRPDAYTQRAVGDVARWLTTHTKPGLMLRGYVGVGKTTVMMAAAKVLAIAAGRTMKIVDARAITTMAKNDEREFDKLIKEPLLGIDDLGTEPATVKSWGNALSPVAELLTQRYVGRRFTVITTNLAVKENGDDELREVYGERLFDRFREAYNFINYDSKQTSYRRQAQ